MAYELRRPLFDLSGSLAARVAAGDTQITCQGSKPGVSNVFAALPTDYTPGLYLPLTIANDSTGKSEIVWATGHASASPTLTVVRAREGTDLQAFEVGDVVRCAPTVRDVVSGYANRAALPSDPHIGMRALVLDEGVVVERSPLGWVDSAPIGPSTARKHRWTLAGAALSAGGDVLITGLTGTQTVTAGTIATMSGGQLTLNKAGLWTFSLAMFGPNAANRNQGLHLNWPSGAFPGIADIFDYRGVFGGSGAAGNGLPMLSWTGYVSAAQAAIPIKMYAYSSVALTGCQYDVFAEYLGA